MNKIIYFLIFLNFLGKTFSQNTKISGKIIDFETNENLAFVSIIYNNENQGLISDLNGKFTIDKNTDIEFLKFSYIGYENKFIRKDEINNDFLIIKLKAKFLELEEVTIFAKENPAHRIIKKASENRDKNNPEKMSSFSYTSYNKLVFTTDYLEILRNDTTFNNTLDSNSTKRDSTKMKRKKFFEEQHLFLTESVSNKSYLYPKMNKEEIIASRTSGFKNQSFTFLATQLQSLSFYDDFIALGAITYLNPISKGSTKKYFFDIQDTIFDGKDSIFVIFYRPKKSRNFQGLRGNLHIHTNGYAISSVIAEPEKQKQAVEMKIQQKYSLIKENEQQAWFPIQLNTNLTIDSKQINPSIPFNTLMIGKSYLKNIKLNPKLNEKEFGHIALKVKEDAHKQNKEIWEKYRVDSLSKKDLMTYHVIDSVFASENFKRKLWLINTFIKGYFPFYFLNISFDKSLRLNGYEGTGLGLGIMTNDKISKWFSIGGYFSYGFKDKTIKYGGDFEFYLDKQNKENKFYISYADDVKELGGYFFYQENNFIAKGIIASDYYRKIMISDMFREEKKEFGFEFRAFEYLQTNLFLKQNRVYHTDYLYKKNNFLQKKYLHQTELSVKFRYAFREQYSVLLNRKISMGTNYPVFWFNFIRGIKELDGKFDYYKIETKISKTFLHRNLGKTYFQLFTGIINGNINELNLYNGHGGFFKAINLQTDNSFNTMSLHSFYSDKFINFFFKQTFGKIPINMIFLNPSISMVQNIGFGFLSDKNNPNKNLQSYEKGYFEIGLIIDNIINTKDFIPDSESFSNFGIGIYYKYGEYSSNKTANNFVFKISIKADI